MNLPTTSPEASLSGPGSGGFRQSMSWLHTWSGLVVGWVLFFMFVTGTFGYVNAEVDRWMRPELPLPVAPLPAVELLPLGEARLRARAADAESWSINFPGERGSDDLSVNWRTRPPAGNPEAKGEQKKETLELPRGLPAQYRARETGGGDALYRMHYSLHYLPEIWAEYIVGVCALFMLVALITGVVVHKKLFKDFFTFRPGKGQRSWLDAHNLLSVTALPFHLMITWSGLTFFLFTYMPAPLEVLYPTEAAHERFEHEAYGWQAPEEPKKDPAAAPLVPLAPLLARAEARVGEGYRTWSIDVAHPGREDARVTIWSHRPRVIGPSWVELIFDGASGRLLHVQGLEQHAVETFRRTLFNLHEGHFSGALLRLLYVLTALAATSMIGTGLVLWSSKRKAKLKQGEHVSTPIAAIDVLNLGTIVGLPIGVAVYFWANRLLPVGLEGRAEWEVHAMFIAWGATFLAALRKPRKPIWSELCWVAACAYGLLPILNALTTDRHLGVTIVAGDWALAGFDLSVLALGLCFAFLAHGIRRKQLSGAAARAAALHRSTVPAAEVG